MSDGTCLSACTAAADIYQNIKFICCLCSYQRLANDYFQCFQTKVVVDISLIDCNFSGSRYKINSCDGFFSSSGSIIS